MNAEAASDRGPYLNLNFDVEFEDLPHLGYCSLEGLESLVAFRGDADAKDQPAAIRPGDPSYANIILRRGLDDSRALWQWYAATRDGDAQPRNGVIAILDAAGQPVMRVLVEAAWPCRWKLGRLDALQGEVLIEEIELVVRKFNVR